MYGLFYVFSSITEVGSINLKTMCQNVKKLIYIQSVSLVYYIKMVFPEMILRSSVHVYTEIYTSVALTPFISWVSLYTVRLQNYHKYGKVGFLP